MPLALEEEIKQIQALMDPAKVRAKRTSRKGQLTRMDASIRSLLDTPLASIRPGDVKDRLEEATRLSSLFDTLQERYEELSSELTNFNLEEEVAQGEIVRSENNASIQRLKILMEKVHIYSTGFVILESLSALLDLETPSSPVILSEFKTLKLQISEFRKDSLFYSSDGEISRLRGEISATMKDINEQISTAQKEFDKSNKCHDLPSEVYMKPIVQNSFKLTLDLPKFSGKPIDWIDFKLLFTAAIDKHGHGLIDEEKSCHLLKAMSSEESRRIVQFASTGKDGYKAALQSLEDAYGRPRLVYPHHVKAILANDNYTYDRKSLRRMRETWEMHLRGLERCNGNTLEQFLATVVTERFDKSMKHEWSTYASDFTDPPTIRDVLDFFRKREFSLDDDTSFKPLTSNQQTKKSSSAPTPVQKSRPVYKVGTNLFKCAVCGHEGHSLAKCQTFLSWDPLHRHKAVKEHKYCFNCLSHAHNLKDCQSTHNCRSCGVRHHTLLHREQTPTNQQPSTTQQVSTNQQPSSNNQQASTNQPPTVTSSSVVTTTTNEEGNVSHVNTPQIALLSTAIALVSSGSYRQRARALLDSGASITLISERLASSLSAKRHHQRLQIAGVTGGAVSRSYVEVTLKSVYQTNHHDSVSIKCHVVPKLQSLQPPRNPQCLLKIPCIQNKSPIADPHLGGEIDLLLGIADCGRCSRGPPCHSTDGATIANNTLFGWTLGGAIPDVSLPTSILRVQGKEDPLDSLLQSMWTLDQSPDVSTKHLSQDDAQAVAHFHDTHVISPDGRFAVALPRVVNPPSLGESRSTAVRRFLQNERSLSKKGKLSDFEAVLKEYVDLDHAEKVPSNNLSKPATDMFYLPTHGVVKESSTTTKLRAVFDASAKSSTGVSLNDLLLSGPNLYPKLTTVLHRFRLHRIAVTADISKMFREIVLQVQERDFHRFLQRGSSGEIEDFRMKRLTFGVKSSPFIATQVLRQLAENARTTYPIASEVILSTFYVDDCLSGAPTVQEADILRQQLCDLLHSAGMILRKWRSNSTEFIETIPDHLVETSDLNIQDPLNSSKTLGIHWNVNSDQFHISVPSPLLQDETPTKRVVASTVAKVFDILGLFSPVIIQGKILLQKLWTLKLDWDTPLPEDISNLWKEWTLHLHHLSAHPVDRRLIPLNLPILNQQLHGFSDASNSAYGAVIYLRTVYSNSEVTITLVTSKARVTPLKPVTIPRLELSAAHLLSKLLMTVASDLGIPSSNVFAWTDSTITLCWILKVPSSLKTFVANRVAAIQEMVPPLRWRHVASKDNPADLASRGVSPQQLINSSLWWYGPSWLNGPPSEWPLLQNCTISKNLLDLRAVASTVQSEPHTFPLWTRLSSFHRLVRVMAWIKRFINNCRCAKENQCLSSVLTSEESAIARTFLLRKSQEHIYCETLKLIRAGKSLPKSNPLSRMDVRLTADQLLHVGGRVRNGKNFPHTKSHLLLSLKSPLTKLLLRTLHHQYKHPGTSTLMAILAEDYYIPGVKAFLKLVSRQCVTCQRAYARTMHQRMGNLPASRTQFAPPFDRTGIDFAGPFIIRRGNPRKPTKVKVYGVIFVCFVTRAVHLELCSDLTTEAFLATLNRFCCRRGSPSHIYTDNGSNFLGAKHELEELQKLLTAKATKIGISHLTTNSHIQWHLSPPRAPHFGGLWEAGVKAMKILLRKLVAPHLLTFEELHTILTEAEAIMNSRPMIPVDSMESDGSCALTPGHFLIGRPLKAPPTPTDLHKIPILRRWNLVKSLHTDLWRQWSARYLQSLQARSKWQHTSRNFKKGDVVIIKDETLVHRTWPLARVEQTYPGEDGLVRTVDLICQGKIFRRSTNRLVLLEEDQLSPPEYVQAS